jgi:AraC family transcriptional regulator of adaptative response/methylated-DNA-[protein]-cysteine methyltransferase
MPLAGELERMTGRGHVVDEIVTTTIESPVGPLIACATAEAVCLLEFGDRRALKTQVAELRTRFGCSIVPGKNEHVEKLEDELGRYFAGELRTFTVPIVYPGTVFQQAVWERLLEIPYGETVSYEQMAFDVGRPGAQRAVGTANGKNRIAIVIPCHRVVNKDGKLGGYGGGLSRKRLLLALERRGGD